MRIVVIILVCIFLLTGCMKDQTEAMDTDRESETRQEESTENTVELPSVIEWNEKEVVIPEVECDYEIWFLSDSHIIIQDPADTGEVQAYGAERIKAFVNAGGKDPVQVFTEFVELANEQKPDMILLGGDILDFPSAANVSFLKKELQKLTVPYVYVMGNHDWTFPWEYMTPEGTAKYRSLYEELLYGNFVQEDKEEHGQKRNALDIQVNSYSSVIELEDLVILAVDDSSNQVAAEAVENIEYACAKNKPVILLQHVPFSTEKLIEEAKLHWKNPVTLGMQIHGGIAPNDVSADLYERVHDDDSPIRAVLSGHVHFSYEEQIAAQTVEIISDAAFKGKAVKLKIYSEQVTKNVQ